MKKKIISILILLTLVSAGVCYLVLNYSYSEGNRSGKLVKLSRKGFFPKTWEGTLDLGSGDKLTWDFSIHDEDLAERLEKHSGKMITLKYRELLYKVFYLTEYDVTAFTLSDKDENDKDMFCRFVKVLRKKKSIVELIRPMILEHDRELLEDIRECQNER